MPARQFRADCSKSLLVLNPEQLPSSQDNFSSSGIYTPDFTLLDAKNVLPSATGYFSYFGKDVDFDDPLDKDIQDIVTFRTDLGDTLLIAMSPDGLYISSVAGNATPTLDIQSATPDPDPTAPTRDRHLLGWTDVTMPEGKCVWTSVAASPLGSPNPWALWTWAIVNNNLYFYQQGLGYIAHIYGLEFNKVRIDKLEPSYIIGEIDQYRWIISGVDSSDTCTDTTKSIQVPGLGTFSTYHLDKAHYVKNIKSQWEDSLLGFLGIGASITETSEPTIVELNGEIALSSTDATGLSYACMTTPLPNYAERIGAEADYYLNCRLTTGADMPVLQGAAAYDMELSAGEGTYIAWGADATTFTIFTFYTPIISDILLPSLPDLTPGSYDEVVMDLRPYGWDTNTSTDPHLYTCGGTKIVIFFFKTATHTVAVWINTQTGANNLCFSMPNGQDITPVLYAVAYNPILDRYYLATGIQDDPALDTHIFKCILEVAGGQYITYEYLTDSANWLVGSNGGTYEHIYGADLYFTQDASHGFFNYMGQQWLVDMSTKAIVSTSTSSAYYNIQFIADTSIGMLGYVELNSTNNPAYSWVVIPTDLTTASDLADLTFIDSGVDRQAGGLYKLYDPILNYEVVFPSDVYPTPPSPYWTSYDGCDYIIRPDLQIGYESTSETRHCNSLAFRCPPEILEAPYAGIPTITVDTDGQQSELTAVYDSATSTLTLGGFKEFTLSTVNIYGNGVLARSFSVSSLMDSNDLWDKFLLEIAAAFPTLTITSNLIQRAEATTGYSISLSYIDFDNAAPVPVLAHDGNCTWTISSTETSPLKLAQVSGITSARGRLVAWDRLNAIYRSSNVDPMDFTPDIATPASVGSVQAVQGNIILCLGWNDGFIVYSTGNIVRAKYTGGTYVFDYSAIADYGCIDPRHISGNLESHFLWTNKGLLAVDVLQGATQELAPELADWLNQHKFPIKVSYIGDRWLFVSLLAQPTTLYSPAVRRGDPTTPTIQGQGTYSTRQSILGELRTFPFGSNLFGTYQVGLIYDTVLQKWGQATLPYKTIFSLNPINAKGFPSEKSPQESEKYYFNRTRSLGGVLDDSSTVIFNDNPDDAYACFGHSKFDVHMWSTIVKAVAEYVDYPSAIIQLEPSWDGRSVNWDKVDSSPINTSPIHEYATDLPCAWVNTTIRGTFHIRSLVLRGIIHADI